MVLHQSKASADAHNYYRASHLRQVIDPVHLRMDILSEGISRDVWKDKYAWETDRDIIDMCWRVSCAIMRDESEYLLLEAFDYMSYGLFIPAGRILTGAGTPKRVTMVNCFVNSTIEDTMESIQDAMKKTALTMQQGGGMGTDFSTIRPENAILKRTYSKASGPLPFMDQMNSVSKTIRSAGDRRGAMMGTLADTHPDLPKFIVAKQEKGRLSEFNISVLISDAFMAAVADDAEWLLHFSVEPYDRDPDLQLYDFVDEDDVQQYVYSIWSARGLWDLITRNTYEYSEPGVIFIDRVNALNNLQHIEQIRCTNPCVTGDTLVLTDKGHLPIKDLVAKPTSIWNGFEWSNVTPFSTGVNKTFDVFMSNGARIRATAYHKWILRGGKRVETHELSEGLELDVHEFPVVTEGEEFAIDAYSQGMYCGDGTKNSEYSNLYKHEEGILKRLIGKIYDRNCAAQPGTRWVHGPMLPKDFVPIGGSATYCVNWLAGLLDADGNIAYPNKGGMPVIQLNAKDRNFLEKTRLMLTRLGVNARFWERKDAGLKNGSNGKLYMCESTACLMIAGKGAYQLQQLGLRTERLDLSWVRAPKGIARKGVKIVRVTPATTEETFCLTEPKRNTFIANGVLTGNCGEQPLPPDAACNLGHLNLAFMVMQPFTSRAYFNWDLLRRVARLGQRFLDNVIDVTLYPLPEQRAEQLNKRRTGLGFTGLADALMQLGLRYGSPQAVDFAERVMREIAIASYEENVNLAIERGHCMAFPPLMRENTAFWCTRLPRELINKIKTYGLRNGVALTVAPTGTTSVVFGNLDGSGCECAFSHETDRRVRVPGSQASADEFNTYKNLLGYSHRLWETINGNREWPSHFVTAQDLSISDHLTMQAAVQRWVDASVSKTINVAPDTTYEEFKSVYQLAHNLGAKGCTTYRPSEVRGSILSVSGQSMIQPEKIDNSIARDVTHAKRPEVLKGYTYQIKWPHRASALYLTLNEDEFGFVREVLCTSKDSSSYEWITALTLMITAIFKKGGDISFVSNELKQIQSVTEATWIDGKHYGSLVAYIGYILERHLEGKVPLEPTKEDEVTSSTKSFKLGSICPACGQPAVIKTEGCKKCTNCDWSSC